MEPQPDNSGQQATMEEIESLKQWLSQVQLVLLRQSAQAAYERVTRAEATERGGVFRRRPSAPTVSRPETHGKGVAYHVSDGKAEVALENQFPRLGFRLEGDLDEIADAKPTVFLRSDADLDDVADLAGWSQNRLGEYYRYLDVRGGTVSVSLPDLEVLPDYTLELKAGRSGKTLPDGLRLVVLPAAPEALEGRVARRGAQKKK